MNKQSDEQALIQLLQRRLDEGVEQLDSDTRERLRQMRHTALETLPQPRVWWQSPLLGGVMATASVTLLVLYLWVGTPVAVDEGLLLDDLELLSSEDLELSSELEFYLWLESERGTG
ncbi:hypothetical protein [Candidatus Endoriftia persephonae]|jgi:hypothetical protein|uniref:DUF3619 family protein n=4 Tax=Gammaproteobacteria TaxID=1236 RepID=G2FFK9_9GAMM|nr:hypothetical protein [Candidatus Endoriftia persephone]EGV52199.1 hypothetical protein Rifp1Sym_an00210 [endosymbiont of Riftia pachyptila (vent Ph05)]EGW54425.1 hypothetical protein TevJSym_am00570 [endosymbiont of Tevnia jerichonana (vent Tica)]KRT55396.1 hypothetical protein Ga0074115_11758 [endosymbiont of Ridgeia piscesae]KRT59770.1 hypothetical protein Ga0076813_15996 [endosymbiont of Ridgeia piscesae]USF87203.1 DUF3619 family protein [Candidatus Endoriftia persephone]